MILFFAPAAFAYTLSSYAWPPEAMPLTIEWAGTPAGLDHDATAAALQAAVDAWTSQTCGGLVVELVEVESTALSTTDGKLQVVFEDPDDDLPTGVTSITIYPVNPAGTFTHNGETFSAFADADIVLNDGFTWYTDSAIEAGACSSGYSLQATLTYQLGHLVGLGTACDEEGRCPNELAEEATMRGDVAECDTAASSLGIDDIAAIQLVYARTFDAACDPSLDDPLAVTCHATFPDGDAPSDVTWDFGDGATSADAAHTYAAEGAYTVTVCATWSDCGTPMCRGIPVIIAGQGSVAGEWDSGGSGEEETTGKGGCATAPGTAGVAVLVGMGLLLGRRRPRR